MSRAILAWLVVATIGGPVSAAESQASPLALTLASSQETYLLGEPIILRGVLKNSGSAAIKEFRVDEPPPCHAPLQIFISLDGARFQHYGMGIFPTGTGPYAPQTLEAGQQWAFELRILYTPKTPSRLALETPGKYFLKVGYPLISRGGVLLESNVVSVEIRAPEGADADVWRAIRTPDFVYFLQSGIPSHGDLKVIDRAIELLRSDPPTRYHPAIRWALEQHLRRHASWLFTARYIPGAVRLQPELEEIRQALGIPLPPEGPFPEDKRLDAWISYAFPQQTPYEEVFQAISTLSGVPLRVHPELRCRSMACLPQTTKLREFMRVCVEYKAAWVPDGKGYKLVPAPEEEGNKH
jgi:hypothetical protein